MNTATTEVNAALKAAGERGEPRYRSTREGYATRSWPLGAEAVLRELGVEFTRRDDEYGPRLVAEVPY